MPLSSSYASSKGVISRGVLRYVRLCYAVSCYGMLYCLYVLLRCAMLYYVNVMILDDVL